MVWTFTAALLWRGVTSEEWGQTGTLSLASLMTHETIYHIYINWIRTPNGPAPCLPGRGSIKHLGSDWIGFQGLEGFDCWLVPFV